MHHAAFIIIKREVFTACAAPDFHVSVWEGACKHFFLVLKGNVCYSAHQKRLLTLAHTSRSTAKRSINSEALQRIRHSRCKWYTQLPSAWSITQCSCGLTSSNLWSQCHWQRRRGARALLLGKHKWVLAHTNTITLQSRHSSSQFIHNVVSNVTALWCMSTGVA